MTEVLRISERYCGSERGSNISSKERDTGTKRFNGSRVAGPESTTRSSLWASITIEVWAVPPR